MDIHRVAAEAVALLRESLEEFARKQLTHDNVIDEATGNAAAVVEILAPHVV